MEPFDRYQLQEKRREQSHTAKQVPPHERDRLPNARATSQNPNPLDALSALTPPPELVLRKSDGVQNKGRREFADKPKPMNKQTRKTELLYDGFIAAPGCPFTAGALFGDLRSRLAKEHRHPMSYERLARIMGQSTSTTHHWFGLFHHPHVLGFLSLLERLSPAQRHSFISAHCRDYATFDDPRLAHAPGRTGKLIELLKLKAGLTIVTGGTDSSRTFVFTALGHAATRAGGRLLSGAGIDLHLPTRFVPVESLVYIDEALGPNHARQLIQRIWPRVLTSAAPQLFFNGVWSAVPEVRDDLLRCAMFKHVIIAEQGMPDVRYLKAKVFTPIHVLTLSASKLVPEGILVACRRVKRATRPEN
jgi:hypothetical protein